MNTKLPPRRVRKALVALAATVSTTVATLVLTTGPAAAGVDLGNHNENAATDAR